MIDQHVLFLLLVGVAIGLASGYVGSFMVIKRMALVGDALTHVALPGMALALLYHVSPMIGAFIALIIAVVCIWYLEKSSEIYPEALVGIFFTASLALGILITPELELIEALFGNVERLNGTEGLLVIFFSILIIVTMHRLSKKLVLSVVSDELATSTGISTTTLNLIYLFLVGSVVALGVVFIGSLLTGALVIVPAVSAKNVSTSLKQYYILSMLFGAVASVTGLGLAYLYHVPSGPAVVLSSTVIFIITYIMRNKS